MRAAEIEVNLRAYITGLNRTLENLPISAISELISIILQARDKGRTVFLFGNGGSAATASHFACDLSKGTILKGKRRVKASALTDNVPLITAWANDSSFESIFAEQLDNVVQPEDIVIGITTSGNSENILTAISLAKSRGARTVALAGQSGGKIASMVDLCVKVPSSIIQQVEDSHLAIQHMISVALLLAHDSER